MSRNEWGFAGFILFCVIVLSIICFSMGMAIAGSDTEIPKEEVPIVYDSAANDSIVIKESKAYCPECGRETIAFNDEVVCRNEDCPNYGLAVSVKSVD